MNLRDTIGQLSRLACDWSHTEVATLAQVTEIAAERYSNQLVREGVLLSTGERRYMAGPKAEEWRSIKSKTRAGGSSRDYLAKKVVHDALAKRDFEVRTGRAKIGDGATPVPQNAEKYGKSNSRMVGMMTYAQLALFLGVSKKTIANRVKSGEYPVLRLSYNCARIPKTFVAELLRRATK